jgi:hypothetical protein
VSLVARKVRPDNFSGPGRRLAGMRHRWSAWLGVAVSVTVLGLVIGSVQHAGTRDRDSAASWPSAGVINAWMAAAISSARAEYVLQMIVTTPHGVTRAIIDDPGLATELVHNCAGATVIEAAVREVSGPVRKYESRTVNFAAGTWSQSVLVAAPAGSEPSGGQHVESPAEAIAAQLRHPLGAGGHALRRPDRATWCRAVRAATIDGEPVYVLVLSGPGGPPATVWISRSSWLPVQSASPGMSISYEWTAHGTIRADSLWPFVPAGLTRIPPA